jgi:histidinol-phosphate phosphatase family protein
MVVTNQSGVARGMFAEEAFIQVQHHLRRLLAREGVPLAGFYYCPHLAVGCSCRKPQPGLLRRAAQELRIDLPASWMIRATWWSLSGRQWGALP